MGRVVTLEEALDLVKQLSPLDKVRLIERIVPDIERELMATWLTPRKSLLGLCADLGPAPSAEEIDQARREEWANICPTASLRLRPSTQREHHLVRRKYDWSTMVQKCHQRRE